jgi:hypothetical protein
MGANEEQLLLLSNAHVTHVSYVLILYSMAFLLFLYVSLLLNIYASHAWPIQPKAAKPGAVAAKHRYRDEQANGRPSDRAAEARVEDVEEFELEGLMSDDDADEGRRADLEELKAGRKETQHDEDAEH